MISGPITSDEQTVKMSYIITFDSGSRAFCQANLFARAADQDDSDPYPDIFFRGKSYAREAVIVRNGREYRIIIMDPMGDRFFTEKDATDPSILVLDWKKGGDWVKVHQGIRDIPLGGDRFQIRSISPDGDLVELEREK